MNRNLLIYVGTFTEPIRFGTGEILVGKGQGIHAFALDMAKGELSPHRVTTNVPNPSYLAIDQSKNVLYSVNELKTFEGMPTGTVSSFAVDSKSGELAFLNQKATGGTDPCHVAVNSQGSHVMVANFMSGSVAVFPVMNDGRLGEMVDFHQHVGSSVDPQRQAGPHAHSVVFSQNEQNVFVPDLGLDVVKTYKFDSATGHLSPSEKDDVPVRAGAGPRHLVLHPSSRFAWVVNELDSTITGFAYDPKAVTFDEIETLSTLPEGVTRHNTCSGIHIGGAGRFLYASNRGDDSIAIFQINMETGHLLQVGHQSTAGKTPRGFAIDPTSRFLMAGNQDSDTITVFSIDPDNGTLTQTSQVAAPTPVCIMPTTYEV